jgi:hypothetical protein
VAQQLQPDRAAFSAAASWSAWTAHAGVLDESMTESRRFRACSASIASRLAMIASISESNNRGMPDEDVSTVVRRVMLRLHRPSPCLEETSNSRISVLSPHLYPSASAADESDEGGTGSSLASSAQLVPKREGDMIAAAAIEWLRPSGVTEVVRTRGEVGAAVVVFERMRPTCESARARTGGGEPGLNAGSDGSDEVEGRMDAREVIDVKRGRM